jgi:hypothetical protein
VSDLVQPKWRDRVEVWILNTEADLYTSFYLENPTLIATIGGGIEPEDGDDFVDRLRKASARESLEELGINLINIEPLQVQPLDYTWSTKGKLSKEQKERIAQGFVGSRTYYTYGIADPVIVRQRPTDNHNLDPDKLTYRSLNWVLTLLCSYAEDDKYLDQRVISRINAIQELIKLQRTRKLVPQLLAKKYCQFNPGPKTRTIPAERTYLYEKRRTRQKKKWDSMIEE